MIAFDQNNFFIKVILGGEAQEHAIQIGFSGNKRLVKLDQQTIQSYKDLTKLYSIVTLSEDDMELIKGSPEVRRLFLDQALSMQQDGYVSLARRYRHIVQQRNALIMRGVIHADDYMMWTTQLWDCMQAIQQERISFLNAVAQRVNQLIEQWFAQEEVIISFAYKAKNGAYDTLHAFLDANPTLEFAEKKMGRSLVGAHLDDVTIQFGNKTSRNYASRGQQKLILVLIKVAQTQILIEKGQIAILLLDDFMADFDPLRAKVLMELLLSLKIQIIITAPSLTEQHFLLNSGAQHLQLPLSC